MSNRTLEDVISSHALRRWLERVEGMKIDKVTQQMIRNGASYRNDKDILDYIQSHYGRCMDGLRREIMEIVRPHLKMLQYGQDVYIAHGGATIVLSRHGVKTVLPESGFYLKRAR